MDSSNIVHETRTALNVVLFNLRACRRQAAEGSHLWESLDLAERNAEALSGLLEKLVRTRDSGGAPLGVEKVSLAQVVDLVFSELDGAARAKGLRLSAEGFDDISEVAGEAALLQRAVTHLLSNAVHFAKDGEVVVTARLRSNDGNPAVVISVRNAGVGFTEEQVRCLLLADDDGERTRGGGTGLVVSREIVEAHGGRLWIEAGEDEAIVSFSLPADGAADHEDGVR